jgi:copper chaperone
MEKTTETIEIAGMSCGHCVAEVKRALEQVEGVDVHEVSIGSACISYNPQELDRTGITRAIEESGCQGREHK